MRCVNYFDGLWSEFQVVLAMHDVEGLEIKVPQAQQADANK